MGKHSTSDSGRPTTVLTTAATWSEYAWQATARKRYCAAYCPLAGTPDNVHNSACAYATDRWIDEAIAAIRRGMLAAA